MTPEPAAPIACPYRMSTPPDQPGPKKANQPIEKQLDDLLIQIEDAEPGVIDREALPDSYNTKSQADAAEPAQPAAQPPDQASDQASEEPAPAPADQAAEPTPEQADMLAALNDALQGISDDPPAEAPSEAGVGGEAAPQASAEPAEALSMEEKLQQEIASLMNSEPQAEASPPADDADDTDALAGSFESPEQAAAISTPSADDAAALSTEDQIAMEIEGLLNTDKPDPEADAETDKQGAIDELDNMLASEIDADDELAGDFQTVEDVTAGIQVQAPSDPSLEDEHAATARDVAAELDSQPEDLPSPPPEPAAASAREQPAEDPFAVLSEISDTAEKNEVEHQRRAWLQLPTWQRWLATAKDVLFSACYAINYPARRLSSEWRANIGYIALLNLFFGVGLWIVLILF